MAVAAVLVLVGCGGPAPSDGPRAPVATAPMAPDDVRAFAPFPPCEGLPTITADPSVYRDEPAYGNASELVEQVGHWAAGVGGFEELWLDRDHNGWVHVGVHGRDADIAALQAEVAERFPGEGVVVVAVPHSLAELEDLADRVLPALGDVEAGPAGTMIWVSHGVLALDGVLDTPDAEAVLQEFAGEPLCVDAVDADEFVAEGPQPTAGDGWRLLGHEQDVRAGTRPGVATTDEQLARLWAESGLPGDVPTVDWRAEIVVSFPADWSTSCPIRLDDVEVTDTTLYPRIVLPGQVPGGPCTLDLRSHSYVVAVERSLLPRGPFVVTMGDPSSGYPGAGTTVGVDLSAPGASATDAQVAPDPAPPADAEVPAVVVDGHPTMPPSGARYVWHPRPACPGVVIGPFDGSLWRLADREPDWQVGDGQELTLYDIGDDELLVFTPAMDYIFVRAPDDVCG